jgi:integrase
MKGRIYPTKDGFVVRFGRDISRWFRDLPDAERFLTGLRYETDKGTFDPRDYGGDKPLSFSNLADQYLNHKRQTVRPRSYANLKNYLERSKVSWVDRNVKTLGYAEIEDFLQAQAVSQKTRANMCSCLRDLWTWLLKRRIIRQHELPEFPAIDYELGWRNIIDIPTQQAIIAQVCDLSGHIDPKIWIGIRWLSVYIGVRPGELLSLKEGYINRREGFLIFPHPKEKRPKIIFLLDEDREILARFPEGLPDLHFFRHPAGIKGCRAGERFGSRYLWKWWKKACDKLGVKNVDLYGGTRHSTVTALGERLSPEQIRAGTLHSTNKAFERDFQGESRNARLVYQAAQNLQEGMASAQDRFRGYPLTISE